MSHTKNALKQFTWKPQPEAQKLITSKIGAFLAQCPGASGLARMMKERAGCRFSDFVDSIEVHKSADAGARLEQVGFVRRAMPGAPDCYVHDGGIFPAVILSATKITRVFLKVDSVADFLATWKLEHDIEGEPFSPFRRAHAMTGDKCEMWVLERRGYRGFEVLKDDPARAMASVRHLEAMRRRRRDFGLGNEADARAFTHAMSLIDAAVKDLGRDWACDIFFQSERDYWMRRNRAGRVQKARQDALGLGWANHDHHTYRSSREDYIRLIACLETLGFHCREKFYAGHEAFWGAQVLEQSAAGVTIFADVDMTPEELMEDFPHKGFPPNPLADKRLGTIGLWCELHGEAFLQAGMHHLECQFDWHALRDQLEAEAHVKTMDPFTTFPYLRQAFTEGERWAVGEDRIHLVLGRGHITPEQARDFRLHGAIGSHLENLERNDGFKGFNQQGVSDIIKRTDPRKHIGHDYVGA